MTVSAYCRVSSRAQDLSTQRHAIERAAKARGDTITDWRSEKRSGKRLHEITAEDVQRLKAKMEAKSAKTVNNALSSPCCLAGMPGCGGVR